MPVPAPDPEPGGDSIAQRIAFHERKLLELREQQQQICDAALLHAILESLGSCPFSSHDLLERCEIDPALAHILGTLTPRRLGHRLARLAGRDLQGMRVSFVTRTERSCIWEILLT